MTSGRGPFPQGTGNAGKPYCHCAKEGSKGHGPVWIVTRSVDGKRTKTFITVLGDITLQQAYYIDGNGRGYFPQDERLGFDKDSLSGGEKRMIGNTAGVMSFKERSVMIKQLAALHVGSKQVERAAEALGVEISDKEVAEVVTTPPFSKTMYLGIDILRLFVQFISTETHHRISRLSIIDSQRCACSSITSLLECQSYSLRLNEFKIFRGNEHLLQKEK